MERVPGGDDVGDLRVKREPVQRSVGLDEAPVLLRGESGENLGPVHRQPVQSR